MPVRIENHKGSKAQDDEVDDDEYETEESESDSDNEAQNHARSRAPKKIKNIVWTGYAKKTPVLLFSAESVVTKNPDAKIVGERYHMAFKFVRTECKLVRNVLSAHGFHEAHPNSNEFNIMWTGSHLKPYILRGLQEFQKVNHFPRSYEITRKDRLFKNIQKLQQTKGIKHFNFVPPTFVMPSEFQDYCNAFQKDKGPWIVKPVASSRGRGIFLVNHPEQVPLDETVVVSKYLSNPLLIDGFKFDVRLYVAVTSYDPLIIYLYEEGLTRFATMKYQKGIKTIRNQCMHLTNYSVNKKSNAYVSNDDADVEDYGNKWSLGALLRYLRSQGKDTTALMMRVEDVIVKTLIAAELPIATACKMFVPYRGNCFELYGFDVLIDDNLRPWVLEVNLSPSLNCDAPIDLKIKSNMLADLFSLIGFVCHDPLQRHMQQTRRNQEFLTKASRPQRTTRGLTLKRPQSANMEAGRLATAARQPNTKGPFAGLTSEEIRIVRRAKEENNRRGGWVRIFPTQDSWELYGNFLQYSSNNNWTLFQHFYPEKAMQLPSKATSASTSSSSNRIKILHTAPYPQMHLSNEADEYKCNALERSTQYERKLSSLNLNTKKKRSHSSCAPENKTTTYPSSMRPPSGLLGRNTLPQGIATTNISDTKSASSNKNDNREGQTKKEVVKHERSEDKLNVQAKSANSNAAQASEKKNLNGESQQKNGIIAHNAQALNNRNEINNNKLQKLLSEFNVVEQLHRGKTLTKIQARHAFATYLRRVEERLNSESKGNDETLSEEDNDSANEQMDLVLRFLKRAAGNLQCSFKVTVPSKSLPLSSRRKILSKQLAEFVNLYSNETNQMIVRQQIEKQHKTPLFSRSNTQINEHLDDFMLTGWVDSASESALEEVLTTYTKLHRSASIFLGSTAKVEQSPRPPHLPAHLRRVLKQPDSTSEQNENNTKKKLEDEPKHDETNGRIMRRSQSLTRNKPYSFNYENYTIGTAYLPKAEVVKHNTNRKNAEEEHKSKKVTKRPSSAVAQSSYETAVAVYTNQRQTLATVIKHRPASSNLHRPSGR
ncbi:DgyrCDS10332 [Dimorphilus gyrociliatus]|uniref:Tubulin--tyrosine ligase-like protein 5 n=1 Tax=Dimorphilus gyrociliatus TaxID=2664684 RepID=A0A7I8VZV2_9ANNE|nr:DgyrCDS10332 [Dimorphilus gyrociliatus]